MKKLGFVLALLTICSTVYASGGRGPVPITRCQQQEWVCGSYAYQKCITPTSYTTDKVLFSECKKVEKVNCMTKEGC